MDDLSKLKSLVNAIKDAHSCERSANVMDFIQEQNPEGLSAADMADIIMHLTVYTLTMIEKREDEDLTKTQLMNMVKSVPFVLSAVSAVAMETIMASIAAEDDPESFGEKPDKPYRRFH